MHVFLIAAVSADGFIDRGAHQTSTEWTSAEDKKFFRERTKQAGVMIVGRTTFETIGRALPGRKIFVISSQPKPEKFADIPDSQVEYTSLSPQALLAELENTELIQPDGTAKKITEVAVSGGASIYSQYMEAGVIDTLYLTMEPVVFGEGIKLFAKAVSPELQLQLQSTTQLGEQTVVLEYAVAK